MNEIKLRCRVPSDDQLFEALNQVPEVQRFIGGLGSPPPDFMVRVIEASDGVAVGVVSIGKSQALDGRDAELVCAMLPSSQRSGFGAAACREMLRDRKQQNNHTPVIACVDKINPAGAALVKKLGGTFLQKREFQAQDIYTLPMPPNKSLQPGAIP